jgi:hypothetical protein
MVKLQKHSSPAHEVAPEVVFQKTALLMKLSCAKHGLTISYYIWLAARIIDPWHQTRKYKLILVGRRFQ